MAIYYVNKNAQSNGDHEVHTIGCQYLPAIENRIFLGDFPTCKSAVTEAKKHFSKADGCFFCSNECHKR